MTPKVLTVIPRYWPAMGGAEQHTRALQQELSASVDCRVATFCGAEPFATDHAFAFGDCRSSQDEHVPIQQLAASGVTRQVLQGLGTASKTSRWADRAFRLAVKPSLKRALKDHVRDVDIIHCVYNGFTPAAEVAARFRKPFVWTPLAHTTLPKGTGWSSAGFRKLYQRADALIAMTPYEKAWLTDMGADADKVHVAPMAPLLEDVTIDPQKFKRDFAITEANIVLFLGRVTEAKGARLLIEAADRIWASHPDTALIIAGPYDEALMATWLKKNDARLKVCGPLCEASKQAALQVCDLVCVPSAEESLGVVYLEAWAFEKPVVAANIPVLRTVISDQEDGLLVNRNVSDIADAVVHLLDNPARAATMGQRGKLKVEQQYTWSNTAETLTRVYEQLLKG